MARRVFPSRLELKSPRGSAKEATGEGQLEHLFVGLSGADEPSVGPYGHPQWVAGLDPFALLHDVRVRLVDKAANLRQDLGAPATLRPDPLVDEMRDRHRGRALRFRTGLGLRLTSL